MPLYMTRYATPEGPQSTQCYAKDLDHLQEVIKLRGMDETKTHAGFYGAAQPKMASDLLRQGRLAEANHALIWASMIATRAGVITAWDLLNDFGMVHELAHEMHTDAIGSGAAYRAQRHRRLAEKIEAFERTVPGLHPCWAAGDTAPERYETKPFDFSFLEKRIALVLAMKSVMTPEALRIREKAQKSIDTYIIDEYSLLQDLKPIRDSDPVLKPERPNPAKHKGGSRRFAEQQRAQGAAARADKAKLVEKLRKGAPAMEVPVTPDLNGLKGKHTDLVIVDDPHASTGSVTGRMVGRGPRLASLPKRNVLRTGDYMAQADMAEVRAMADAAVGALGGVTVVHDEIQITVAEPDIKTIHAAIYGDLRKEAMR